MNGFALIQYLSGLRFDLPNKKIFLQPHLPPGWSDWSTKRIPLHKEGAIQLELKKIEDEIHFKISRTGGTNPIQLDLEFGLFGEQLIPADHKLAYRGGKDNLLFTVTEIPVTVNGNSLIYRFKIKNSSVK